MLPEKTNGLDFLFIVSLISLFMDKSDNIKVTEASVVIYMSMQYVCAYFPVKIQASTSSYLCVCPDSQENI